MVGAFNVGLEIWTWSYRVLQSSENCYSCHVEKKHPAMKTYSFLLLSLQRKHQSGGPPRHGRNRDARPVPGRGVGAKGRRSCGLRFVRRSAGIQTLARGNFAFLIHDRGMW